MAQCTAKSKASGQQCRRAAMRGKSVCYMHGGKSKGGVESPTFKHGQYIPRDQSLPSLGALVEEQMRNPDYLLMQEEVALLRARLRQLVVRLDGASADPLIAYKIAKDAHAKISDAMENPTAPGALAKLETGRNLLGQALGQMGGEFETWREVRSTLGSLSGLVAQETVRQKNEREFMRNDDLVILFGQIQNAILELGLTEEQKLKLRVSFNAVLEHRRVLAAGTGG